MSLSPLRKQVQSLNKQLQTQNIEMKDLINFLNKSTPKQHKNVSKVILSSHTKLNNSLSLKPQPLRKKEFLLKQKNHNNTSLNLIKQKAVSSINQKIKIDQKYPYKKQSLYRNPSSQQLRKSVKHHIPSLQKTKQENTIKLTKSVTYHNLKNATIGRKYLKLSRPDKKLTSSCSFCQQSSNLNLSKQKQGSNAFLCQTNKSKYSLKNCAYNQKIDFKFRNNSSNNKDNKQNINNSDTKKKNIIKFDSQQILLKNDVKLFFDKKAVKLSGNTTRKWKNKLFIQDPKEVSNNFLTRR